MGRVTDIRLKETENIKKIGYLFSNMTVSWVLSPFLVSLH